MLGREENGGSEELLVFILDPLMYASMGVEKIACNTERQDTKFALFDLYTPCMQL